MSPGGAGRGYWLMKDAGWYTRNRVLELGETHGTVGLSALDWLSCYAKQLDDDGYVKSGYIAVARGIFSTPQRVRPAILCAAELGLLDDFAQLDAKRFECRVSGWASDQQRAMKQARNDRSRPAKVRTEPTAREQQQMADLAAKQDAATTSPHRTAVAAGATTTNGK